MAGPRNILITGCTSGVGLALAKRLAKRHRVIVTGRKMSPELKILVDEMPDLEFVEADQNDPEKALAAIQKILKRRNWDKLDNLILNAGVGWVGAPQDQSAKSIRDLLQVNLVSNMVLAHGLFSKLQAARGKVTFIGSTSRKGANNFAAYTASKAALHGFARALREEWRDRVFVQCLHPGPTRTPMHAKSGFKPGLMTVFFVSADDMAAMLDKAIARGRPFANLTLFRFWNGSSILGRGL